MNKKALKITYWATTIIFSLLMSFSAYQYLTNPMMADAFVHLGFPAYFRVELALAKFIGSIVLLAPFFDKLKEWAYSGFSIVLVSAAIAHYSVNDDVGKIIAPIVIGIILSVSYISYKKMKSEKVE